MDKDDDFKIKPSLHPEAIVKSIRPTPENRALGIPRAYEPEVRFYGVHYAVGDGKTFDTHPEALAVAEAHCEAMIEQMLAVGKVYISSRNFSRAKP